MPDIERTYESLKPPARITWQQYQALKEARLQVVPGALIPKKDYIEWTLDRSDREEPDALSSLVTAEISLRPRPGEPDLWRVFVRQHDPSGPPTTTRSTRPDGSNIGLDSRNKEITEVSIFTELGVAIPEHVPAEAIQPPRPEQELEAAESQPARKFSLGQAAGRLLSRGRS